MDYLLEIAEYTQHAEGNEHDAKALKLYMLFLEMRENGLGYFAEQDGTLYLVPSPTVRINAQNLFHSDRMPAIEWKGGLKLHFLNGVHFPEELWRSVTSGEMPFQDILAIEDIDQRTQAMRYGSVWDFVKHAKGKKLDELTKTRVDGTPVKYWLYKFPSGKIFTEDAYYALYTDLVPGSTKVYMSGVEKSVTVAEAMAWKFSNPPEHILTPEEWLALTPGIHMN